ncbi:peroxide stress protein YaaA [Opitutales bacterium]|nr:peroxide stress protein YaaA [Opitutales bacterium]
MDFKSPSCCKTCTEPEFLSFSKDLISGLSKISSADLSKLMGISPKLSELNRKRYQDWKAEHNTDNSKQAILAFKGDVYEGIKAWDYTKEDFVYAQKNIRLLSGLYGLLRPLDLIQPHRLEMGTVYANPAGKDLYAFWGDRLCKTINRELKASGSKFLINLASQEYFKSTQPKNLEGQIISPVFKDEKNGKFKIISFYAKKARGMMASHLIKNRIDSMDGLRQFNDSGYEFESSESTDLQPVFLRSEQNRIAA